MTSAQKDLNIFSLYVATISPVVEAFLERIGKDYNLPVQEMKQRYLYNDRKAFDKMIKKHKPKKTRKIHPYNVFLSDKNVIQMLLDENNTDNQTEINKEKGQLWEKYKNDPKIYSKYENITQLENIGLLTKKYRNEVLSSWSDNEKNVSNILKSVEKEDATDLDLSKVLSMLNLTEVVEI